MYYDDDGEGDREREKRGGLQEESGKEREDGG